VHRRPPTSHFAQRRFRPVSRPSSQPRASHLPRAPAAHCQVGPPPRHARVTVVILPLALWLASKGQSPRAPVMTVVAACPAASRRIRAVHVPRATAAISSRRRHPWLSPTLAARGIQSPIHLPAARGGGEGEEKEELGGARSSTARHEAGAAREEEPDPREPRTPATSASSTSSPPRRSASPTSAASLLVTAPRTPSPMPAHQAEATQVRTPPHLPCGHHGHRAETERPRAAAPLLVRPAIEPGWDALFCRCRRLRRRARHPPILSPLAVGRHHRSSPPRRVGAPRRVRVESVPARAPVQATALASVHPSTRAP
jgi:hypothetical protein